MLRCFFRASLSVDRRVAYSKARRMSTHSETGPQDPQAYCLDLVKKRDYDAYLNGQFYPNDLRSAFFGLRAFYVELASVQEAVSNSIAGKMRIQFWRDAVKHIADVRLL